MTERLVELYGRVYRWRYGDTAGRSPWGVSLHLVPPPGDGEVVVAARVTPWWPTPCAAFHLAEERRAAVRAVERITERLVPATQPEGDSCA